jgi:hypothetical protein
MPNVGSNQILLLAFLLLVGGVGTYITYVRQQGTLNTLAEKIQTRRAEKEEIDSLRADRARSKKRLAEARNRWHNRYKRAPDTIASSDVVAHLTDLTQTGFRAFDVASLGTTQRDGYSTYRFDTEGKAYFSSLYRLVWRLENGRPFYRIRDLQLSYLEDRTSNPEEEKPSVDVLVSFQMTVEAIYGVVQNLPRPSGEPHADTARRRARRAARASVPSGVGPSPVPSINPFYPLIFEEVPPNEEGRVNVETAQFVSVVGGQAVFATDQGPEHLREGDRVYLGKIVEVDAAAGRVVARLNKGGIVERVERQLNTERPAGGPKDGSDP